MLQLKLDPHHKVPELELLYSVHNKSDTFVTDILYQLKRAQTEKQASWLLKKYFGTQENISHQLNDEVLQAMLIVQHWEAQLHLLQTLPYLTIPKSTAPIIKKHLLSLTENNNKFIRAWAYNGLHVLQSQYPQYRYDIMPRLKKALLDESPSVQARIRQLNLFSF